MANITRSAKPGSEWTENDLDAYNITIVSQDSQAFFGSDVLLLPTHHRDFIEKLTAEETENFDSFKAVRCMDRIIDANPTSDSESAVIDFAMQLLWTMGYDRRTIGKELQSRKNIRFRICGQMKNAKADVCVVDRFTNEILLLVLEEKRHTSSEGIGIARAQLVAGAVAAAQENNGVRNHLGLDILESKLIPGIVILGTSLTFFKVPVTRELMQAVENGHYPVAPTEVAMHRPQLLRPLRRLTEGMRPLDNRRNIIACLEAFKQFLN